nr:aspartate aminotransferase-like [Nerophis lumbriciformis]
MFDRVALAPPDAILGLVEAFQADPRPDKINLGIGVYRDGDGRTPVFGAIAEAERQLLARGAAKVYLPIDGIAEYNREINGLVFGAEHPVRAEQRLVTVQTPGGTGALRVAADFLRAITPRPVLWLGEPSWPNHRPLFESAGFEVRTYRHFDPHSHGLAFDEMSEALARVEPGDVVLLHGCCHNPSGVDPSADQWRQIIDRLSERRALPLIDLAYQGFAAGLEKDVEPLRQLAKADGELMVASSASKNFGLYGERVGALHVVSKQRSASAAVLSQLKVCVRRNYSNPPTHGAALATTVLANPTLRDSWQTQLEAMRQRIHRLRRDLTDGLDQRGVRLSAAGNGFIARQNGMFSFTGLDLQQVLRLREEHGVYAVDSGRINVAGIRESELDRVCDAISAVAGAPAASVSSS